MKKFFLTFSLFLTFNLNADWYDSYYDTNLGGYSYRDYSGTIVYYGPVFVPEPAPAPAPDYLYGYNYGHGYGSWSNGAETEAILSPAVATAASAVVVGPLLFKTVWGAFKRTVGFLSKKN